MQEPLDIYEKETAKTLAGIRNAPGELLLTCYRDVLEYLAHQKALGGYFLPKEPSKEQNMRLIATALKTELLARLTR